MAYFGGGVSAKPWSKLDLRFIAVFALSFGGIVASLILAKDLPIFRSAIVVQPSQATTLERVPKTVPGPMLVAIKEISAGTAMTPGLFRLELRPTDGLEQQIVGDFDTIKGAVARFTIAANTPLVRTAVTKPVLGTEITSQIPIGYRAVSISVDGQSGVEGWVQPGSTVDVVWATDQDHQAVVSTIVENARVLSVQRNLEPKLQIKGETAEPTRPSLITLLVLIADAQKIHLAKASGSLNLSLRGIEDASKVGSSILSNEALLARRDARNSYKEKLTLDGKDYVLVRGSLVALEDIQKSENQLMYK
jgi:Flp pilus assembly protein CpaB